VDEGGGGANSLKVVRVSDWHAELCILSNACDSCSLSNGVELEREASDPRREPMLRGNNEGGPLDESLEDISDQILC
jgi:hypothetical protein